MTTLSTVVELGRKRKEVRRRVTGTGRSLILVGWWLSFPSIRFTCQRFVVEKGAISSKAPSKDARLRFDSQLHEMQRENYVHQGNVHGKVRFITWAPAIRTSCISQVGMTVWLRYLPRRRPRSNCRLSKQGTLDVQYVVLLHKEMRILPMLKVSVQEDLASSVTTFSSSRSRQA